MVFGTRFWKTGWLNFLYKARKVVISRQQVLRFWMFWGT